MKQLFADIGQQGIQNGDPSAKEMSDIGPTVALAFSPEAKGGKSGIETVISPI